MQVRFHISGEFSTLCCLWLMNYGESRMRTANKNPYKGFVSHLCVPFSMSNFTSAIYNHLESMWKLLIKSIAYTDTLERLAWNRVIDILWSIYWPNEIDTSFGWKASRSNLIQKGYALKWLMKCTVELVKWTRGIAFHHFNHKNDKFQLQIKQIR